MIYYLQIEEQIEMTFIKRDYSLFFNSIEKLEEYKDWHYKNMSSLHRIIKQGIAEFNHRGILCEK